MATELRNRLYLFQSCEKTHLFTLYWFRISERFRNTDFIYETFGARSQWITQIRLSSGLQIFSFLALSHFSLLNVSYFLIFDLKHRTLIDVRTSDTIIFCRVPDTTYECQCSWRHRTFQLYPYYSLSLDIWKTHAFFPDLYRRSSVYWFIICDFRANSNMTKTVRLW